MRDNRIKVTMMIRLRLHISEIMFYIQLNCLSLFLISIVMIFDTPWDREGGVYWIQHVHPSLCLSVDCKSDMSVSCHICALVYVLFTDIYCTYIYIILLYGMDGVILNCCMEAPILIFAF